MARHGDRARPGPPTSAATISAPLTPETFLRKVAAGEIAIPLMRMESRQKAAKGVHIQDLAAWIDKRRDAATREARALAA